MGGVIDFDGFSIPNPPNIFVGSSTTIPGFATTFSGGTKTLAFTADRAIRIATYGSASQLSGAITLDLLDPDIGTQTLTLNLGSIVGGLPGEAVTTIGLTAMSRNAITPTVSMTAIYSNGTSATLSRTLTAGSTLNDTFYGFVAPAGASISSLSITRNDRQPYDDLGFITTVVPEPGCGALLCFGALAIGRRSRLKQRQA